MDGKRLVSNINIRLNLEDMEVLRDEAKKLPAFPYQPTAELN